MKSMTGFGRALAEEAGLFAEVEISSVNRKHLDLRITLPRDALFLEAPVKQALTARLQRGAVQLRVHLKGGASGAARLDVAVLTDYVRQLQAAGLQAEPAALLQLPGVLCEAAVPDEERCTRLTLKALEQALDRLVESRLGEGSALAADLHQRLALLQSLRREIAAATAQAVAGFRDRLLGRLREAGLELDLADERLLKELVLYADRSDVTEEMVRMQTHLERFDALLRSSSAAGRELDFLMQEIGREINTTASKSTDAAISSRCVSFKAELERCREQIQNVE